MNPFRHASDRLPSALKTALCGLAAALAFTHCDDPQVAGTSVGTGNPTEIEVAFKDDSGSVPITGTLAVYASTQIPVPGFSPEPLIKVPVTGASHAGFKADAFKALADTLWPKSSIDHGLYNFNVVVTGEKQGSILRGFSFRKDSNDFVLRAEDSGAVRSERMATVKGAMAPLVEITSSIDTATISSIKDHYLFLYGTGFTAKGEAGRFVFSAVPKNNYDVYLISLPRKDISGSGVEDSIYVFGVSAKVEPERTNALSRGDIQATLPIPDYLKGL